MTSLFVVVSCDFSSTPNSGHMEVSSLGFAGSTQATALHQAMMSGQDQNLIVDFLLCLLSLRRLADVAKAWILRLRR